MDMKNHEGYHDPTAGRAIRNISGKKRRKNKTSGLAYRLREIRCFQECAKCLQ